VKDEGQREEEGGVRLRREGVRRGGGEIPFKVALS
jgi:hypothetical protein